MMVMAAQCYYTAFYVLSITMTSLVVNIKISTSSCSQCVKNLFKERLLLKLRLINDGFDGKDPLYQNLL